MQKEKKRTFGVAPPAGEERLRRYAGFYLREITRMSFHFFRIYKRMRLGDLFQP